MIPTRRLASAAAQIGVIVGSLRPKPGAGYYMRFLNGALRKLPLRRSVHEALEMQWSATVYWSVLANGTSVSSRTASAPSA